MQNGHFHAPGGTPGEKHKKNEFLLDVNTIRMARDIHFRSHWPAMCRRMMVDELIKQNPRFVMNGREFSTHEVSPLFRELIRQYYMTFFLDAYDEIMLTGVVFMRIIKASTGDSVPTVLSSEHFGRMYNVWVRNTGGKNQYRVEKIMNSKGDPIRPKTMRDVIPVDHFGAAPSMDGKLNSVVASLIDTEIYFQNITRLSLQAEYTLSNPPVVTETTQDAPLSVPLDERSMDVYENNEAAQEQQRGIYDRNRLALKNTKDHFDMSFSLVKAPRVPAELGQFHDSMHNNVRVIPYGQKVAQHVLPVRNARLEDMTRNYEVKISAAYGIPRALVVQDNSVRTAGAFDLVETALRSTLTQWNNIGGQLLTSVYLCIYYPEDCNFIAKILPGTGEGMTEDQLYSAVSEIADVQVIIPLGPHGTVDENVNLFDHGIITWDELVMSARSRHGFGPLVMPEPAKESPAPTKNAPVKRKKEEDSEPKDKKDTDTSPKKKTQKVEEKK